MLETLSMMILCSSHSVRKKQAGAARMIPGLKPQTSYACRVRGNHVRAVSGQLPQHHGIPWIVKPPATCHASFGTGAQLSALAFFNLPLTKCPCSNGHANRRPKSFAKGVPGGCLAFVDAGPTRPASRPASFQRCFAFCYDFVSRLATPCTVTYNSSGACKLRS